MAVNAHPFKKHLVIDANGDDPLLITLLEPDPGELYLVAGVLTFNDTDALVVTKMLVGSIGSEIEVWAIASAVVDIRVVYEDNPFLVGEGEKLIVHYEGITASDRIVLDLHGVLYRGLSQPDITALLISVGSG